MSDAAIHHTRPPPAPPALLRRLASGMTLAWGWRRAAIAVAAGGVTALAQAPFHFVPALFVGLTGLVLLLDGAVETGRTGRLRRFWPAFLVGWCFGFGYFLAGLWWVGSALFVDIGRFGWLLPIAVAALPAGLALFWGAASGVARIAWPEGPARIVVLALSLSAAEWLRSFVLTGFPWNPLALAIAPTTATLQSVALVGQHGLTLLAILFGATPAVLFDRPLKRGHVLFVAAVACVAAAHIGYGVVRLSGAGETAFVPDKRLRIVQPAIDQWQKGRAEFRGEILAKHLELSARGADGRASGFQNVSLVIWPETAYPFVLGADPAALAAIGAALPPGVRLVIGAFRAEPPAAGETGPRFFNTLYVLGDDGRIEASFDKAHLTPFGEYLPFHSFLGRLGLDSIAGLQGGLSSGPGRRTIAIAGFPPASPLLCYEVIFPGEAVAAGERPGWLLNLTNDGWFGRTAGPYQHLHQARLRAVEEGLPLVRAANTGISAVVDAYGRSVAETRLGDETILDASLPAAVSPTPAARAGGLIFLVLWFCALVTLLFLARSRRLRVD